MPQPNDLSRSLVALDQNSTIIAVVELSQASWLIAGMLPGIERQPCKKLDPSPERLPGLLEPPALLNAVLKPSDVKPFDELRSRFRTTILTLRAASDDDPPG